MYVISIKRIKDCIYFKDLVPHIWEYACYDDIFYEGALTTSLGEAKKFRTKEMAKEEFSKWIKSYNSMHGCGLTREYDVNTLAIRKLVFTTEEKLVY